MRAGGSKELAVVCRRPRVAHWPRPPTKPTCFSRHESLLHGVSLLKQKELLLQGIEQNLFTLGIFVNDSKAFDRIDHQTLLKKLEAYVFRGIFLSLIIIPEISPTSLYK